MFKIPLFKALIAHVIFFSLLPAVSGSQLVSVDVIGRVIMAYIVLLLYLFYLKMYMALNNYVAYLMWLLVAIIQFGGYCFYNYNTDYLVDATTFRP